VALAESGRWRRLPWLGPVLQADDCNRTALHRLCTLAWRDRKAARIVSFKVNFYTVGSIDTLSPPARFAA
jgi:hypothetical protein